MDVYERHLINLARVIFKSMLSIFGARAVKAEI